MKPRDKASQIINMLEALDQDEKELVYRHLYSYLEIDKYRPKQRTLTQNSALHLWLSELSIELNNRGLDMRTFLKPGLEIPWDEDGYMAKRFIWRPVQLAMTGKKSSAKLSRQEMSAVYEKLSGYLSRDREIDLPWPHKPEETP